MNLLQLETNTDIEQYFDEITNNNFMPLISSPTRITKDTKTLIDNILFNQYSNNIISGNLTVGISDHLPQFALIPNTFKINTTPSVTPPVYARNFKNINVQNFNHDLDRIDWNTNDFQMYSMKY